MEKPATTRIPIHDLIGRRWSSRAFADRPVERTKLISILEAARWAPSSRNEQPWAYLLATRETPKEYGDMAGLLSGSNKGWADKAPALILAVAHLKLTRDGAPNRHALYDLGQAVGNLVTQATSLGLSTHQLGGFDVAGARKLFQVPEDWEPVVVISLGYPGEIDSLPESLREREMAPRQRKPLDEFVFSGTWRNPSASISGQPEKK